MRAAHEPLRDERGRFAVQLPDASDRERSVRLSAVYLADLAELQGLPQPTHEEVRAIAGKESGLRGALAAIRRARGDRVTTETVAAVRVVPQPAGKRVKSMPRWVLATCALLLLLTASGVQSAQGERIIEQARSRAEAQRQLSGSALMDWRVAANVIENGAPSSYVRATRIYRAVLANVEAYEREFGADTASARVAAQTMRRLRELRRW